MKILLFVICTYFICPSLFAQYYFTDIVANNQSLEQYKLLLAAKVKQVKAVNYGTREEVIEGFGIEQIIKDNGKKIITKTSIPNSSTSVLENNYVNGRLTTSINSNLQTFTTLATTTTYTYDSKGLITSIASTSTDTAASTGILSETHIWLYNEKNLPTQMYKVKGKDTLKVLFTLDEKGRIAEEKWTKNGGRITENYYYYYNDVGLLTDVVRFNYLARKLLPDFVYDYNNEGKVVKMTQTVRGGTDYLVWKYTYNDKGLKETESCYNKQKHLLGKVVYDYSY